MASSSDVHVRICGQEIVKYDLEIKALVQVVFILPIIISARVLLSSSSDKNKDVAVIAMALSVSMNGNSKLCVFLVSGYKGVLWATGGAAGSELHCQGKVQSVKTEDSGNLHSTS